MTDDVEQLYAQAADLNDEVAVTGAAYKAATAARKAVFRKLRAAGQGLSVMAGRLGLSTVRVGQIVGEYTAKESPSAAALVQERERGDALAAQVEKLSAALMNEPQVGVKREARRADEALNAAQEGLRMGQILDDPKTPKK